MGRALRPTRGPPAAAARCCLLQLTPCTPARRPAVPLRAPGWQAQGVRLARTRRSTAGTTRAIAAPPRWVPPPSTHTGSLARPARAGSHVGACHGSPGRQPPPGCGTPLRARGCVALRSPDFGSAYAPQTSKQIVDPWEVRVAGVHTEQAAGSTSRTGVQALNCGVRARRCRWRPAPRRLTGGLRGSALHIRPVPSTPLRPRCRAAAAALTAPVWSL
jgi:hypothetical protein